jgi:hypothetical protein
MAIVSLGDPLTAKFVQAGGVYQTDGGTFAATAAAAAAATAAAAAGLGEPGGPLDDTSARFELAWLVDIPDARFVAVSPDGKLIANGQKNSLRLRDAAEGEGDTGGFALITEALKEALKEGNPVNDTAFQAARVLRNIAYSQRCVVGCRWVGGAHAHAPGSSLYVRTDTPGD